MSNKKKVISFRPKTALAKPSEDSVDQSNQSQPSQPRLFTAKKIVNKKLNENDHKQIEKLESKNKGYFQHIRGNCPCGLCICGGCKCPQKSLQEQNSIPGKSLYQEEYIKKPLNDQLQSTQKLNALEYKDNFKMNLNTTNRNDYTEKPICYTKSSKERPFSSLTPFSSATSYQAHYPNVIAEKIDIITQNRPTVMKDLEFIGRTVYKDTFQGKPTKKEPFFNFGAQSNYSNPISPNMPMFAKTSSQYGFKPFKSRKYLGDKKQPGLISIPSFYGQYKTITKSDYTEQSLMICPAKKILNERSRSLQRL